MWKRSENLIKRQSPNADEMLVDGKAPEPGQIFTNPTLAQTFRAVAKDGPKGFYEGRVAESIVEVLKSMGGVMELEDLRTHVSEHIEPISYTYQNEYTLHECPPSGQGLVALIALGIIEEMQAIGKLDIAKSEFNGVEYTHALIEALRLAFADARAYIADTQHHHVPVKELLSKVGLLLVIQASPEEVLNAFHCRNICENVQSFSMSQRQPPMSRKELR